MSRKAGVHEVCGHLLRDGSKNEVSGLCADSGSRACFEIGLKSPKMVRSGRVGYEFDLKLNEELEFVKVKVIKCQGQKIFLFRKLAKAVKSL